MKKVRRTIGSVNKAKEGNSRYIKISEDITLKKGQYVNLESPSDQIAGLQQAMQEGKLSEDYALKQIERLRKTPDFVSFHLITQVEVE